MPSIPRIALAFLERERHGALVVRHPRPVRVIETPGYAPFFAYFGPPPGEFDRCFVKEGDASFRVRRVDRKRQAPEAFPCIDARFRVSSARFLCGK